VSIHTFSFPRPVSDEKRELIEKHTGLSWYVGSAFDLHKMPDKAIAAQKGWIREPKSFGAVAVETVVFVKWLGPEAEMEVKEEAGPMYLWKTFLMGNRSV
jgi:hypothetical protein